MYREFARQPKTLMPPQLTITHIRCPVTGLLLGSDDGYEPPRRVMLELMNERGKSLEHFFSLEVAASLPDERLAKWLNRRRLTLVEDDNAEKEVQETG